MSEKLSEILGVEHHEVTMEVAPVVIQGESDDNTEDADFTYARGNYYELIEQGKAAVNTAMRIASESENPRAIEVLSGLMRNMADINKQLIGMSKDKVEVKALRSGGKTQQSIGTVQNAVFVGSSSELNKLLSKNNS
jgi:hypothetical protein